ncbi:DNA adenine methylase [uncultured Sutterella sp.]|uniref:DNA adenine methylase n=1 Tax=uncultured Sutterella sp. TaxID=286133 RepID=UPI002638CA6E|nr:DNA adenine methylase [uncultured Sutterella sp.]
MIFSPLRYPGGKSKITPLMVEVISSLKTCSTYIEPFAGGAGVAINLLLNGKVDQIVINDYDKSIYSFWRAVKEESDNLLSLIEATQVNIDEWHRQRAIYAESQGKYSIELAFATFYLNRTNRSGIISAGPIGGLKQNGEFRLDARFNKINLMKRIKSISLHAKKIKVYNQEVRSFIRNTLPKYQDNSFIYFDPPYYENSRRLYKNSLKSKDHNDIANYIANYVRAPWVITYDAVTEIEAIYRAYPKRYYLLNYSAARKVKGRELVIFKDETIIPNTMLNSSLDFIF